MKKKGFGVQLDEAAESTKDAHLISYVRFLDDNVMVEGLFFL